MAVKVKGAWTASFQFQGTRYRRRSPENSCASAKAFELVMRQRIARGEPAYGPSLPKTEPKSMKEFAGEWLVTYVLPNNKPSERKSKRIILDNHLLPFFGSLPLEGVSVERIEHYKGAKLRQGLSAKTINNQLVVLGKLIRTAVEWGVLDAAPKIKLLKAATPKFDHLSPVETALLLSDTSEPMWREMLLVAVRTGLRMGELFALDWSDIDLGHRLVSVRRSMVDGIIGTPKSGKERHVALTDDVCRALSARRKRQGLVFEREGGGGLSHSIAGNAIRRICKRVGLRPIGWHTLRHTFASELVRRGGAIRAVQLLMGHSTVQMTERYSHLAPSDLQKTIALLEQPDKDVA